MLKVLAAVLAVLSAAISITIYTATLPAVQKQAADNAEAIETLGGSVSDNAEAIENLQDDIKYTFLPKQLADITGSGTTESPYILNDNYTKNRILNGLPIAIKGGGGNSDWLIYYFDEKNTAYGATDIVYQRVTFSSTPLSVSSKRYRFNFTTWQVSIYTYSIS